MASESNEISDLVKKCKILLLDIEGTTTSISFVKDKLFPYAEANVKEFLENQWENEDVKEVVAALRKLSVEDQEKNVEGVVAIPGEDAGKDEQIEGLVKSVQWQMSADRKAGPLKQLQGLIWKQGYDKGDIKGHVYDDVAPALELWRATEGQQVYIYSSGSVQAQKLLFGLSVAGDLLPHIEGHFDTAVGAKQEAASYVAIAEKIGCKPEEMLFLTDIVKEAEAARASGLQTALVSREGNAPLPAEASAAYPVLHSLEQLAISNKRKPQPQDVEVPAKVPKTDIEADVKTASEMEVAESTPETVDSSAEKVAVTQNMTAVETVTKVDDIEKMEVEEEGPVAETVTVTEQVEKVAEKAEDTPVCIEVNVEDVTKSNGVDNEPVSDIKPVIEESVEKTEKNETENMETESTENVDTVETAIEPKEPKQENVDEISAPVAEETPPIITVQDVTNDKENVSEETEIIEDLVPIIEEPSEMEDLKNVGDVLDKECEEILSKVQDVTNLDSIQVKPMLSSISEETMESENGENTNDIVESILDSEMELSAKTCDDIDVSTVQEITDAKTDIPEEKAENQTNPEEASVKVEKKPAENDADNEAVENAIEVGKVCGLVTLDGGDKIEKKEKDNISTTTDAKTDEITKESKTDVTNGNVQESKSVSGEEKNKMTDSVVEPASNVAEEIDSKQVPAEAVENKQELKEKPAEQEETKIESEESTVLTESKIKTTEKVPEAIDNKLETKYCTVGPDSEMESEDSTVKPVENLQKLEDNISGENKEESKECLAVQAENKMESEKNTVELEQNKAETKESVTEQVNNKADSEDTVELVQNIAETKETTTELVSNKIESENNTVELGHSKAETKEIITKQVDDKMESEGNADLVESKTETNESSIEQTDNKMESENTDSLESKTDTKESTIEQVDNKMECEDNADSAESKAETKERSIDQVDNKMESEDTPKPADKVMEVEESTAVQSIAEPDITAPENDADKKETPVVPDAVAETKEAQPMDVQMETEATEQQVNGNTNGEPEVNQNGDASKDEELSARLSVENGEKSIGMNGANGNGDSAEVEKAQGDNKVEMEIPDIKVKTVGSEETRTDPLEQPVEA